MDVTLEEAFPDVVDVSGEKSPFFDDTEDASHNKTWTPIVDESLRWDSMDIDMNKKDVKHQRPIYQSGIDQVITGQLKARVVPPSRIPEMTSLITRETSSTGERSKSLPVKLFSKNLHYQRKVIPIGTAKPRRLSDQLQPLANRSEIGKSRSLHDMSTDIESASAAARKARVQQATRLLEVSKLRMNDSGIYANDEIIYTKFNTSITPDVTVEVKQTRDENQNKREPDGERVESAKTVESEIIVPADCQVCYSSKPNQTDDENNLENRQSYSRSDSSISLSDSCREHTPANVNKAEVINEIIKALSNVSFEGSADLKPKTPVKQVILPALAKEQLPPQQVHSALDNIQSLHRSHIEFKRTVPVTALKISKSCGDLNGKTKREVVKEIDGPIFRDSHCQTMFRIEPIGVLWEMASRYPSNAVPLYAQYGHGHKVEIFKHLERTNKTGSLEDNGNYCSEEDSGAEKEDYMEKDNTLEEIQSELNTSDESHLCTSLPQRPKSDIERGIAWEIYLRSAEVKPNITLQEAFERHCHEVKERSLSRLERVAKIKMQRYDRDKVYEQYISLLPPSKKDKIDKTKLLLDNNGNNKMKSYSQTNNNTISRRKKDAKKQSTLDKSKKTNRIAADIYKNRIRNEVLAGKTTFPVHQILLC